MIRPLTCICMLLAGGSGLYLYQSKHQAQMVDREVARTLKASDAARERIGVLRGEWALLNEPERLAALSQAHLGLKTLMPAQFATPAELGARLPPPVDPDEPAAPEAIVSIPETAQTSAAVPPQPARAVVALVKPSSVLPSHPAVRTADHHDDATPSRPPVQVASVLPMPASPLPPPRPLLAQFVNISAVPIAAPPPAPRPVQLHPIQASAAAARADAASASPQPVRAPPAGLSIGDSVLRMQAGTQAAGPAAAAPPLAYKPPFTGQTSASALGGIRPLLPPPVPVGAVTAASVFSAR